MNLVTHNKETEAEKLHRYRLSEITKKNKALMAIYLTGKTHHVFSGINPAEKVKRRAVGKRQRAARKASR